MDFLYLIVGLILGFGIAFLFFKLKQVSAPPATDKLIELAKLQERLQMLQSENEKLRADYLSERNSYLTQLEIKNEEAKKAAADFAKTSELLKVQEEKLTEQKKDLENLQHQFTKEFENIANKIFEDKSEKFTKQNKEQIGYLLNPLGEKLTEFSKRIQDNHQEQEKERSALKEQIKLMADINKKMSDEALNLTRALKHETKTQGNWGELIMEKILEKSGLRKGVEYTLQESVTIDGKRVQPDAVIHLPDEKKLVVDSKVSLVAYERYVSATDDGEKQKHLSDHILSVRTHVKLLSEKNYQNLFGIASPDFVLMFIPVEPAFSTAVGNDIELYNDAFDKNIVLVTTSTLLATLRTIANVWKQEYQTRNTIEIAKQGADLYDKFQAFTEDLINMGKKLNSAKTDYDDAMNKLSTGKGNLVKRAENLKALGVKASKQINPQLVEKANDEE
jgi:DNA recombination protein RmuC